MPGQQQQQPYPRPDFTRPHLNWELLNGPWDFLFDDTDAGLSQGWHLTGLPSTSPSSNNKNAPHHHTKRPIIVPYAFQTPASGINLQEAHEVIWYERTLHDLRSPDDLFNQSRILLRFGAVDYECSVWLDGRLMGAHRGGQVGFDVDVSEAFRLGAGMEGGRPGARLTLRCRDSPTDLTQPRGKQYWGPVPENIFYTPSSGIWQGVWWETVPGVRIGDAGEGTVVRGDGIERGVLRARIAVVGRGGGGGVGGRRKCVVEVETGLEGVVVGKSLVEVPSDKEFVEVDVNVRVKDEGVLKGKKGGLFEVEGCWKNGVALWTPDHPILYDVTIRLKYEGGGDEARMRAGMRKLSWLDGDGTLKLNGKPLFQALVLDQGYWPETGMTPPSQEALKADIEMSKRMGFNGCRKHQKVEDPVFLYWADQLGYLVWGEIGNAYEFSQDYVERFNSEWMAAVKRDINHPCIVTWTPANESWGYNALKDNIEQRNHIRSLYYMTKTLDPSRPINDNCGWEHVVTDLTTYHDYQDADELAVMCSKMEDGILARKAHGEMFTGRIYSGSTLLDPGTQHRPGAPVICTEFGGVNIAPAKGTQAGERDWGYTTAADPDDLLKRLRKLVMAVVEGGIRVGLCIRSCAILSRRSTACTRMIGGKRCRRTK